VTDESDELIGHNALEFGRAGALAAFTCLCWTRSRHLSGEA
jgi:hypothetical protein